MLDLLSELLEEIFVKITKLEDVIALSSTCRRLAAIVEHPSLWRRVLPKIQLVERGTEWRGRSGVGRRGWVSMEGHGRAWKYCEPCQAMPSNRKWQGIAWHDQEGPGKIMEDKVRAMATFIDCLKKSKAIFVLLHKMIYKRYPGKRKGDGEDRVIVSAPSSPQLHTVSGRGLEMLALTGRQAASHSLHEIRMHTISPSILIAMAALQRSKKGGACGGTRLL